MRKAIFGITAKVDDGSVFGVLLAEDKKTVISPCFNLTAKKLKAFSKDNIVVERVVGRGGREITMEVIKE